MKKYIKSITLLVLGIFLLSSCEEEFIPDTINAEQQYIVEGYVQTGDQIIPTYVILTKSIPFFSEIGSETINDIFVKNAIITVYDGNKETTLNHFCLDDLPDDIKPLIKSTLGIDSISGNLNFCAYVDIANNIIAVEGKQYDLKISVDNKTITATTTIPKFVPLDSLWTEDLSAGPVDSIKQLFCKIKDPINEMNYYRYQNSYIDELLVTPFVSVIPDFLFDGKDFKFPMDRAVSTISLDTPDDFRYFKTGDSIQVQWISVDQAQYEFWNSLELDRVQQGPFSSYLKANTNVTGALGTWCGQSSRIYKVANPK